MKTEMREQFYTGERSLFAAHDLKLVDTIFGNGEY